MGSGQSLIGMNSGATNGLTSTDALSRAAYAAANETVRGRGPDAAVLAANGVIDGASRGRTVTAPGGQSIGKRPNSLNTDGDRVRRLH